jgi:hypothetical protein
MGSPCVCLNPQLSTNLYIYQNGFIKTSKAFSVILAKQTLENGIEIKSGTRLWIPGSGADSHFAQSGKQVRVPNWKLNELIKSINMQKLKGIYNEKETK